MSASLAVVFKVLPAWDERCSMEQAAGYRPAVVDRGVTREILTVHIFPPYGCF